MASKRVPIRRTSGSSRVPRTPRARAPRRRGAGGGICCSEASASPPRERTRRRSAPLLGAWFWPRLLKVGHSAPREVAGPRLTRVRAADAKFASSPQERSRGARRAGADSSRRSSSCPNPTNRRSSIVTTRTARRARSPRSLGRRSTTVYSRIQRGLALLRGALDKGGIHDEWIPILTILALDRGGSLGGGAARRGRRGAVARARRGARGSGAARRRNVWLVNGPAAAPPARFTGKLASADAASRPAELTAAAPTANPNHRGLAGAPDPTKTDAVDALVISRAGTSASTAGRL